MSQVYRYLERMRVTTVDDSRFDNSKYIDFGDEPREKFINTMLVDHYMDVRCPFCGDEPDIWADPETYTTHVKCGNRYCGNKTHMEGVDKTSALYGWYLECKNICERYNISLIRR